MMWLLIASVAALVAATIAAQVYLHESVRDHVRAQRVWDMVYSNANKILSDNFPAEVREMAMGLSMTTGCGCYIRSILIEHYTPSIHRSRMEASKKRLPADAVTAALKSLKPAQKRQIDTFLGSVIAFDMLSNPLQGWLLRHAMAKRFAVPKPAPSVPALPHPSRAEKEAVIRTVVRKKPELCAA